MKKGEAARAPLSPAPPPYRRCCVSMIFTSHHHTPERDHKNYGRQLRAVVHEPLKNRWCVRYVGSATNLSSSTSANTGKRVSSWLYEAQNYDKKTGDSRQGKGCTHTHTQEHTHTRTHWGGRDGGGVRAIDIQGVATKNKTTKKRHTHTRATVEREQQACCVTAVSSSQQGLTRKQHQTVRNNNSQSVSTKTAAHSR